jgi:hypothetical protein
MKRHTKTDQNLSLSGTITRSTGWYWRSARCSLWSLKRGRWLGKSSSWSWRSKLQSQPGRWRCWLITYQLLGRMPEWRGTFLDSGCQFAGSCSTPAVFVCTCRGWRWRMAEQM